MPGLPPAGKAGKGSLLLVLSTLAGCAGLMAVLLAGDLLTRPARHHVEAPPPDLPVQVVSLRGSGNQLVSGWWIPGRSGTGTILLLHGIRADRRQMLGRARFLHRLGYHTLLVDLPAHGESSGDRITFGVDESAGVAKALEYLAAVTPQEKIGVIGVSLGAASVVLLQHPPPLAAVILESMYPTIADAARARLELHLGSAARALAPLLLWQLPLRLGIPAEQLRPIDALPALHAPVLIASGTLDLHTPWHETQSLFRAAPEPKALWPVPGAAHVDLHAFAPHEYERVVAEFLAKHLRSSAAPR